MVRGLSSQEYMLKLVEYAISMADPKIIVPKHVELRNKCIVVGSNKYCLGSNSRLYVVGAGKATGRMAEAVEELLGDLIMDGVISVPEYMVKDVSLKRIRVIGAGHPVPDDNSIRAAEEITGLLRNTHPGDIVLALISGGGSALMEKPYPPITLEDLRTTTKLLLNSGASIEEVNTVRKHLSTVKGGRLLVESGTKKFITLLISDVPGDKPELIASGPTLPDPTTYRDAVEILKRYRLWLEIPGSVRHVLEKGLRGDIPETPKPGDPVFNESTHRLIASNLMVLEKLRDKLVTEGYRVIILTSRIEGESRDVGVVMGSIGLEIVERGIPGKPPLAILFGGETTVTVRNPKGMGGRCQELVLSFLAYTRGREGLSLACFDTDGIDGISDVAGAMAIPVVWKNMLNAGDNPYKYLDNNDSYHFFKKYGGHIKTGPTGTNVNTIGILLAEPVTRG